MEQAPNTVELDEHLKVVISALHGAVNRAVPGSISIVTELAGMILPQTTMSNG